MFRAPSFLALTSVLFVGLGTLELAPAARAAVPSGMAIGIVAVVVRRARFLGILSTGDIGRNRRPQPAATKTFSRRCRE